MASLTLFCPSRRILSSRIDPAILAAFFVVLWLIPHRQPSDRATERSRRHFSTRPWQVLKKRRWQLIAASVLLAIWIVFLVTMAAYN